MKKLMLVTIILVVIAGSLLYFNEFRSTSNIIQDSLPYEELTLVKFEVPSEVYLAINENYTIPVNIEEKDGKEVKVKFISDDKKIVNVINDNLVGKGVGNTTVKVKVSNNEEKEVKVIVTDLISEPIINNDKPFLECKEYSESEAKLLDVLLDYKIKEKGYMTRSGALEAARFLLLRFKQNINYFSENGRLENHSNILHVDAEGRYYHKGLYLSEDKYKDISDSTETGPVMWGCPLKNVMYRKYYDNGLNCSGFITWALFNAGYDIKDVGAGDYNYVNNELLDLRPKEKITMDLLKSGSVKAGDLIGFDGHIAMIIGIDKDIIYVGESYETGTRVREFTSDTLLESDFTDIILMDEYYKSDGNYSEMW